MAFDLAATYSAKLDQVYTIGAQTNDLNGDGGYSFTDAQSVKISTVTTEDFVAYDRTDTLTEAIADVTNVEKTIANYTISQYKKNVKHMDYFDELEQPAVDVAKFELAVTQERYTPMIDKYRLSVLCAAATANGQTTAGTAEGYTDLVATSAYLTNGFAPRSGRIIYGNTVFESSIKLDDHFVAYTSEQIAKVKDGSIGYMLDGSKVTIVPDSYMPAGFRAVMVHKDAVFGPRGIKKAQIKDVPGKPGKNIEVYARYDLFVLEQKELGIAAITESGVSA
jgi:hypothetical protein